MHGFDVGDLERRLVRAEISAAAIPWADRKVARHRASLRVQVSLCEISSPRGLLQPIGVDQYSCRGIDIFRRAQARQPNLALHTPDVNLARAFVHDPSGQGGSVAVFPGGSSIAIDA